MAESDNDCCRSQFRIDPELIELSRTHGDGDEKFVQGELAIYGEALLVELKKEGKKLEDFRWEIWAVPREAPITIVAAPKE